MQQGLLHAAEPGGRDAVRQAMWRIQGPTRAEPGAFEAHVELPHTVRFVAEVEPLLDHPFNVTVAEKIW